MQILYLDMFIHCSMCLCIVCMHQHMLSCTIVVGKVCKLGMCAYRCCSVHLACVYTKGVYCRTPDIHHVYHICQIFTIYLPCMYHMYHACTICTMYTIPVQYTRPWYHMYHACTICTMHVPYVPCMYHMYHVYHTYSVSVPDPWCIRHLVYINHVYTV